PGNPLSTAEALRAIINGYPRESGLRNFEREIASICRKVARRVAEGQTGTIRITPHNVSRFLGAPKILPEEILKNDQVGIATGMAWTASGGDVMFIEATAVKGTGRLTLPGSLVDVMTESAEAALGFARPRARQCGTT